MDWIAISKGEYAPFRDQAWATVESFIPASGSILNGSISNILSEAFGGAWRMPNVTTLGGDYNQVKIYRAAFLGEVERELMQRRLATYKQIYAAVPVDVKFVQSGHVLAVAESLGIQLTKNHLAEATHYCSMRRKLEAE